MICDTAVAQLPTHADAKLVSWEGYYYQQPFDVCQELFIFHQQTTVLGNDRHVHISVAHFEQSGPCPHEADLAPSLEPSNSVGSKHRFS